MSTLLSFRCSFFLFLHLNREEKRMCHIMKIWLVTHREEGQNGDERKLDEKKILKVEREKEMKVVEN